MSQTIRTHTHATRVISISGEILNITPQIEDKIREPQEIIDYLLNNLKNKGIDGSIRETERKYKVLIKKDEDKLPPNLKLRVAPTEKNIHLLITQNKES